VRPIGRLAMGTALLVVAATAVGVIEVGIGGTACMIGAGNTVTKVGFDAATAVVVDARVGRTGWFEQTSCPWV
jgi:hypothetical protein